MSAQTESKTKEKPPESRSAYTPVHSPLPWHVSGGKRYVRYRLPGSDTNYNLADCDMGVSPRECEGNAEFIVRACNSHAALYEALEAILAEIASYAADGYA